MPPVFDTGRALFQPGPGKKRGKRAGEPMMSSKALLGCFLMLGGFYLAFAALTIAAQESLLAGIHE